MTDQELSPHSRRTFFRGLGVAGAAAVTGAAVPTVFAPSASAAPVPGFNEKISRDEVIERAMFWVDDPRAYSMENFDIGPEEDQDILWRMDCSGFVSMALAARFDDNPTGLTTETLHPDGGYEISHAISKEDLLPGDFILPERTPIPRAASGTWCCSTDGSTADTTCSSTTRCRMAPSRDSARTRTTASTLRPVSVRPHRRLELDRLTRSNDRAD